MHMPTKKKYLRKKTNKLCLMGQIVVESHSFLEYYQGSSVFPTKENPWALETCVYFRPISQRFLFF